MSPRHFLCAICTIGVCAGDPLAAGESISPQDAYERLHRTGELSSVTVAGPFDLARLQRRPADQEPFDGYQVQGVEFAGPVRLIGGELERDVRIKGSSFEQGLRLQQCALKTFAVRESVFVGELVVENCVFKGFSPFDGNELQSNAQFHLARFLRRPSFRGTSFRGRAEFLECQFGVEDPPTKAVSFANATFEGPTLFNNTGFHTRAKFQSAVFESDASFLNTRMNGGATFRNVHFRGDAEFRFCRMGASDFGNRDNLTLFAGRADFRGCDIESAVFDYVEFRGETSFVNAGFGAGGASFRHANFGKAIADFSGTTSDGPLVLSNAHIPALRLYWREVREAVLAGDPDSKLLGVLHARLKESGDTDGAIDASYHLARRTLTETLALPLPPLVERPSAFLDGIGRRLVAYGEWVLWGWPTGYGTKLGRILLLAATCWLLAALPIAAATRVLARVPIQASASPDGKGGAGPRSYEPVGAQALARDPEFPGSFAARLFLALGFTFRLLFKVGPTNIRNLTSTSDSGQPSPWTRYFAALWYLGSGLLVLIALTLANTSPLIDRLLGELFP